MAVEAPRLDEMIRRAERNIGLRELVPNHSDIATHWEVPTVMTQSPNWPRLGPVAHYDMPAWLVTALGVGLGVIGLLYVLTHPEPLSIWILEGILIIVPAAIIVYGGYWIATRPLDRVDRWIAAGWAFSGAVIALGLAIGYVLSEQLSGGLVTESGQLIVFGALGGSLIALLTVMSTQRRYHIPDVAYANEDATGYYDRNRIDTTSDNDDRWKTTDNPTNTSRITPDEASVMLSDHPFYGQIIRVEARGHRCTMIADGGHVAVMKDVHPEWAIEAVERDGRFSVHRSSEKAFQPSRREFMQGTWDATEE
jgi:hypothetical protein